MPFAEIFEAVRAQDTPPVDGATHAAALFNNLRDFVRAHAAGTELIADETHS